MSHLRMLCTMAVAIPQRVRDFELLVLQMLSVLTSACGHGLSAGLPQGIQGRFNSPPTLA